LDQNWKIGGNEMIKKCVVCKKLLYKINEKVKHSKKIKLTCCKLHSKYYEGVYKYLRNRRKRRCNTGFSRSNTKRNRQTCRGAIHRR